MTLRASPPAKLNLTLAVAPRAQDGYHPLRSILLRIGLADELAVELRTDGGRDDQLTVGGLPGCPVEGNLVLRAFELVRAELGAPLPGLAAHLEKRVPLGAGLGGGSSDGASALGMALAAWGVGVAPSRLAEIALELGSDVPFFLADIPAALVEGRGERVAALPAVAGGAGALLATFPEPLSTTDVFDTFDQLDVETWTAGVATDEVAEALRAGLDGERLVARAARLRDANTLWPAAVALAPEIGAAREELEAATGLPWLMSGSGRTLFALFASAAQAHDAAAGLEAAGRDSSHGMSLLATDLG